MYEGEQTMRADSAGPAASQEHGALTASGNARVRVAGADEIHDGYDGTENASRSAKPLSYQNIASRPRGTPTTSPPERTPRRTRAITDQGTFS